MRFTELFPIQRQNRAGRPHPTRLQVERLEDRTLMSVNLLDDFAGLDFDPRADRRHSRPDTDVAAGPSHLVEVTNRQLAFFDKDTGRERFNQSMLEFFAEVDPVGDPAFDPEFEIFDPKVTYDELSGRFIVIVLNEGGTMGEPSYLLVAVSDDSNPLGRWEKHRIEVEDPAQPENLRPDFPGLGWDADAIYVTMNMFNYGFTNPQKSDHVKLITIDKDSVLDNNSDTLTYFEVDRRQGQQLFTMQPAVMHGANLGDPMYFVELGQSSGQTSGAVNVIRMNNKLSAQPTFTEFSVSVPQYHSPTIATQPGGGDLNIIITTMLNAAWRGNHLVASHNVGTTGADKVDRARWYEFDTSGAAPTLIQSGEIDPGPGIHTYMPDIEIAPNFDLGLTFMQSSATEYMSMYVTGRKANDPLGTMQTPVLVKAGQANFHRILASREVLPGGFPGDYSGISIDPVDSTFWAANEYATAAHAPSEPGGFTANWGTWIANFSISSGGAAGAALAAVPEARRRADPAGLALLLTPKEDRVEPGGTWSAGTDHPGASPVRLDACGVDQLFAAATRDGQRKACPDQDDDVLDLDDHRWAWEETLPLSLPYEEVNHV